MIPLELHSYVNRKQVDKQWNLKRFENDCDESWLKKIRM